MRTIKGVPVKSELRRQAEEKLKVITVDSANLSGVSEKISSLIHELQVHQIELEMQNDELRRVQLELEKTRDKYSHLYDFAPVGYLTISDNGTILEANLTCASMLGIERRLLIGTLFSRFINKDDQDIFYLNRMKLIETKSKQVFELRIMRKDGIQFYSQLESIAALIDDNDQIQIRIVMTDVSHLRAERDNLINILSSMADGLYIADKGYEIQYLNPALEKEFGPVDGKKCFEYFNDRKDICPWCKQQEVFSGKTVHWEWYCVKNQKTYDLIDTLLRNPDGSLSKLEIFRDITEFREIQKKLQTAHDELEKKVEERTAGIFAANKSLKKEIVDRKKVEKVLSKNEIKLKKQTTRLEKMNTALNVLLDHRKEEKINLEKSIIANVKKLVLPNIEELGKGNLSVDKKYYLDIIKSNIEEIISPFSIKLSSSDLGFTPTELKVANYVKEGLTSKEIASMLNISHNTVMFHRKMIRKKLGITNKKTNSQTYIKSFS